MPSRIGPGAGVFRVLSALSILGALACSDPAPSVKVGVLLPLSGPGDFQARRVLEWVRESVNAAGGLAGRELSLEYVDLENVSLEGGATQLLDDPDVRAVMGPLRSLHLAKLAPAFIARQMVAVSLSTSGDIARQHAGQKFVWRTVESDVQQTKMLLLLAAQKGARKVALVVVNDPFGNTFFDWFGFFATEIGLEVTEIRRFDQTLPCDKAFGAALASRPDVVVGVPGTPEDAVCLARVAAAAGKADRLLLADVGRSDHLLAELGPAAEGIEGTTIAWSSKSGFEEAFRARFGELPTNYAANTYDALLLIAMALERSGGVGKAPLSEAFAEVVDARGGPVVSWDRAGIAAALRALRHGVLPDLSGTTGPLEFDAKAHLDLISSTYEHWRVKGGGFVTVELIDTAAAPGSTAKDGTAAFRTLATEHARQALAAGAIQGAPPRTGGWALIAAASHGWRNYRHQADALAQYRALRDRGMPDDHIVLVMADDLAGAPENPEPGVVRNVAGGPDLRAGATIDYRLDAVGPGDLLAILGGQRTERTPVVLASGPGDNVYVYLVGHGGRQGIHWGTDVGIDSVNDKSVVTPEALAATVTNMERTGSYRRMLIAVETCHGGVLGRALASPRVLLLAGANPYENSFGANYDPLTHLWRADEFSSQLARAQAEAPAISLRDLYLRLYLRVPGSHVFVANAALFEDTASVQLEDFLRP